jgi:carboxyl-terminal processing protease
MKLHRTVVAVGLMSGVALVSGGWLLQDGAETDSVFNRARVFDEVLRLVSDRYVEPHPPSELYELAVEGMLEELGDPHSSYLDAEEYAQLQITTTGEYGGLGISIARRDAWVTAVGILPETPAERAGVRIGDRMVAIDGASTKGWDEDQAVKRLRGAPGTDVVVTVQRPGSAQTIDFRLTRQVIHVRSVPYAYLLEDGVGYASLSSFSRTSTDELRAAIDRLRGQGMRGLVLDLRSNPGGLLEQGVSVSDLFLPAGMPVVETRSRDPRENETLGTATPESQGTLPVVVLVDEYSASAAEIVAGALQDHDRALVMGAPSYGKGSVQSLFPVSGGGVLKLTTAKWYTPAGRSIQKDTPKEDAAAPADTVMTADGTPVTRDSVKRVPYRTDSGRIVYGGGGIVPDVIVRDDTATAAEKEFFRAAFAGGSRFTDVLFSYAVEYARTHPQLSRDFAVTDAMRAELFRRMQAASVPVTAQQYAGARRYVDMRLVDEIATARFGREESARRLNALDPVVRAAVRALRAAPDARTLLRNATAAQPAAAAAATR